MGFLTVFIVAAGFWPAVLGYTFVAGEKATAQVTNCRETRDPKGSTGLDCSGRWHDAEGGGGSGHVSGVGRADFGRDVEVRIGPLGPYAGGPARSWPPFLTALPLLLAPPMGFVLARRTVGPGRAAARRLLAAPPDGATLLMVGAKTAAWTDGRSYGSLRQTAAPPGFQRIDLPGKRPRRSRQSVFTAAAGLARDTTGFATVSGPAGEPLFVVERRGFGRYEPETWLLDPGGTARAVIRRVDWYPAKYELLRADGRLVGRISTPRGTRSGVYVSRDEHGRQLAVMAASGRRWVLRIEPQTSPLLRDLTLAYLFDSARLHL